MKESSPDNHNPVETPIAVDAKLLSHEELELLRQQSMAAIAALDLEIADSKIQIQKMMEQYIIDV